ncbi:MAPK kinase substrate protein At1g80180-like [Curcuma longa]|uniref:MAPK kinase substrate protein At1g80180-like n=1 Tax=Curcuma longa TaxID=136217 RepID=UPI003D9F4E99
MAELRRSETTFRQSGSSGLVWDETFLAPRDQYPSRIKKDGSGSPEELRRRRCKSSAASRRGGGAFPAHADAGVTSPALDRQSPRLLYFCCPFPAKSSSTKPPRPRRR